MNLKKYSIYAIIILYLLVGASLASQNETYCHHGLCFEIPHEWDVVKDVQVGNDTQIVLSDGVSAIRVDLIKYPDREIDKLMLEHLIRDKTIPENYSSSCICPWRFIYALVPWQANGAIGNYYKTEIIKPVNDLRCSGSGISIKPDGVEQASIHESCEELPAEWVIAWTKPEYDEELIGIHAIFSGRYLQMPFEWHGSSKDYSMQQPLWLILTTFSRGDDPKPTSLVNLV
ncbi:MAG: hypothetical protein GKC10_09590 [Methanosarcinales archaeon]|nr:hypothetical protein [Methanosarcinales archaeon]